MNQSKIGKFICSLRKEKGMTQADLAEKMGVSINAVSKWERGLNLPDASIMQNLCEVLGITLNELFAGERLNENSVITQSEKNLLSLLKMNYAGRKRNRLLAVILSIVLVIAVVLTGRWILIKKGYLPDDQLKYTQVYIADYSNVKGNVDVDKFGKISVDYDIGANRYGNAVFKDPKKAIKRLKINNAAGIKAVQNEYHLSSLNMFNFRIYGTYGWQITNGTEEEKEQAAFITQFMDIYENSFDSETVQSANVIAEKTDSQKNGNCQLITDTYGNQFTIGYINGIYWINGSNYHPKNDQLKDFFDLEYEYTINDTPQIDVNLVTYGYYSSVPDEKVMVILNYSYDKNSESIVSRRMEGYKDPVNHPFSKLSDDQLINFVKEFSDYLD